VDIDERQIARLKESEIPIYEPSLKDLVMSTKLERMSARGFRTPASVGNRRGRRVGGG
jgi:UDP-glucose 6-dehydrogenase